MLSFDKRNTAYDLSLFEKTEKERENLLRIPQRKLKQQKKKRNFLSALVTSISAIAVVATVSLFIYGQVQLFETTEEICSLKKQLAESQSEYTQLEMKLASEMSLKEIENKARERFQMNKVNSGQIEYVNVEEGNKVIVSESGGGSWFHKFLNLFS